MKKINAILTWQAEKDEYTISTPKHVRAILEFVGEELPPSVTVSEDKKTLTFETGFGYDSVDLDLLGGDGNGGRRMEFENLGWVVMLNRYGKGGKAFPNLGDEVIY